MDFIIIGAQKAGTTSLWQYLRHHPSIAMPALKEAPFFSTPRALEPGAFEAFMANQFDEVTGEVLLGKSTPGYMKGTEHADVREVARRIGSRLPDVKLIALLRDPIARAASQYRMSVRRGFERRSFDAAAEELSEDDALANARESPTETNSYLVQGEYGRVLGAYRGHFPTENIHVEQAADLARNPEQVVDRTLGFLGLPGGHRPGNLAIHYHRSGTGRIDPEREAWLFEFLEVNVWSRLGEDAERVKTMFEHFYEVWSVQPDSALPRLSAPMQARLREHYRADAELLLRLGADAPWVGRWDAGEEGG